MASTAAALHILVKHKEQADDILQQLNKGAKFQTLAKKYSTCPSKNRGGDLGEFRKGAMVPAFDKAVFSGKVLEPIGPVKTKFGYHIIKKVCDKSRKVASLNISTNSFSVQIASDKL